MISHVNDMLVCNAGEIVKICQWGRCWLPKMKIKTKFQEWIGFENPYKIPCMFSSLCNVIKPSKTMVDHVACMGIDNLSTLTLKRNGGMVMPEGLCRREGIPSLCCVSGYFGAVLACSRVSYLWSS